jgi:hypothetical protein
MSAFIKAIEVVRGGFVRPAPSDTSFDSNLLGPHLDNAEKKYVRDTIGEAFFEELKVQRTSNVINYNTALGPIQAAFTNADLEALFLDGKLFNLIALGVINESLSFVHFQITSSGVQTPQAYASQTGTGSDMRYLKDTLKENIAFLQREVTKYLCENATKYTTFGFDEIKYCDKCESKNKKYSTRPLIY